MSTGAKRIRGMSLVELMVGMAVGLIGITIITHLYVTNEKYKRSTTGAGQAQVNGAIALYTLERELRMAGAGINHSWALGCGPLQYVRNAVFSAPPAGSSALPALTLAPVVITETANQPDSITLLYTTAPRRTLPGRLTAMATANGALTLDGVLGYDANDMLVVANGATCRMLQVTVANPTDQTITHTAGIWNGGAPLPVMAANSLVFNLGATPAWRIYSVANGRLRVSEVLTNHVTGGTPTELIDDILDLQAEYGKDTDATPGVDAWNTTPPTTAAEWMQVLALRVAVLARSQNYEKPNPTLGYCDATITVLEESGNRPPPSWAGGQFPVLAAATTGLPNTASELRCYKYRVFETIIPLRNMIWRPA
jgi:type IV pilus assembly protein PilW